MNALKIRNFAARGFAAGVASHGIGPARAFQVSELAGPFAGIAMDERRLADLPPFSYMALVRAEATDARSAHEFLVQVAQLLLQAPSAQLDVMGPAPAPMERLGGRFRAQLLLQSDKRSTLNDHLSRLCVAIEQLPGVRRCRWSIDVDPVDLF
jgi:primosomal protein N' (replication factor Y)